MPNINQVTLAGNLTADPELRYTPKGTAVAKLNIAINRVWFDANQQRQEQVTFVELKVWGRKAEVCQQYLKKGGACIVLGRLEMESWEDKASGQKRTKMVVVADDVQFIPSASSLASSQRAKETATQRQERESGGTPPPAPGMDDHLDEPDPF